MKSSPNFKLNKIAMAISLAVFVGLVGVSLSGTDIIPGAYAESEKGKGKNSAGGGKGKKGSGVYKRGSANSSVDALLEADDGPDDDSDRPAWAGKDGTGDKPGGGNKGGDSQKGDDYGDLWVILRDDDGNPILKPGTTFVQPLDTDGNLIPLDDEGHPVDEGLTQEVELGRLNVARAPEKVLDHSLIEALSKLATATVVTVDPAGRLVADGATIDSPLESLALFKAIVSTTPVDGIITLTATGSVDGQTTTYSFPISVEQAGLVAASAIAAASDKTGTLTVDEVMYIAKFLNLDSELSTFVTSWNYERDDIYTDDVKVWILEGQDTSVPPDGVIDIYVPIQVQVNQAVTFNTVEPIVDDGNGIDSFAQAADDAVQVLEFVHDNAIDQ